MPPTRHVACRQDTAVSAAVEADGDLSRSCQRRPSIYATWRNATPASGEAAKIEPLAGVERLVVVLVRAADQRLLAPERQQAALAEAGVEQPVSPALQLGAEVDQDVAAHDQVEAARRRIAAEVVAV